MQTACAQRIRIVGLSDNCRKSANTDCHQHHSLLTIATRNAAPRTYAQEGRLPLHYAVEKTASVWVVRALLEAFLDGAKQKDRVRGRATASYLARIILPLPSAMCSLECCRYTLPCRKEALR